MNRRKHLRHTAKAAEIQDRHRMNRRIATLDAAARAQLASQDDVVSQLFGKTEGCEVTVEGFGGRVFKMGFDGSLKGGDSNE